MPSMRREEALTKLAMEVAEWPCENYVRNDRYYRPMTPEGFDWRHNMCGEFFLTSMAQAWITKHDWLAERQRLINKPSWDDAPEWAEWLIQQGPFGVWYWCNNKPEQDKQGYFVTEQKDGLVVGYKKAEDGVIPAGHDWRTTLERRPDSQKPALSEECMNSDMGVSDGSTASYYELPEGATELQHLISHRNMNAQDGEIFRAIYRKGLASHSDSLRDAKKVLFYAKAEVERLEKLK